MMRYFLSCALYLAVIGILGFFLGRILSKNRFCTDRFPFRSLPFEQDGRIYEKLKIRAWQIRVPDMSRILPALMPPKQFRGERERLPEMIRETCVAELTHELLSMLGLLCLAIWPGAGGVIVTLVYILIGNLPFILIQRFNRPRLLRLLARTSRDDRSSPAAEGNVQCAH